MTRGVSGDKAGAHTRVESRESQARRTAGPQALAAVRLVGGQAEGAEVVVGGGGGGGWERAASTASVLNVQLRSRPDGGHWPSGHRLSSGQFLRPVPSREVFRWRPRQAGTVW